MEKYKKDDLKNNNLEDVSGGSDPEMLTDLKDKKGYVVFQDSSGKTRRTKNVRQAGRDVKTSRYDD